LLPFQSGEGCGFDGKAQVCEWEGANLAIEDVSLGGEAGWGGESIEG